MTDRSARVRELRRRRPRSRFARASALALAALGAGALVAGDLGWADLVSARRREHVARFLGDLVPAPWRGDAEAGEGIGAWAAGLMAREGWDALGATLALSIASILVAAAIAAVLFLVAARTVTTPEPFLPSPRPATRAARLRWAVPRTAARAALVLVRAVPEYVWAFLLVAILGPTAWPAVLALGIHNGGIVGRLGAETVENLPAGPLRALRGLGGRRAQIAAAAIVPTAFPRLLLYFLYRWETCARDSVVLGLLGVASLGFSVDDARTRFRYDEMLFFVLLGAALVVAGDLVSARARAAVRRG